MTVSTITQSDSTPWIAFTPTITAATGTFTSVSAVSRYKLLGKTCIYEGTITVTTVGSAASSIITDLPTAAFQAGAVGVVKETALTTYTGSILLTSTTATSILNYAGVTMAATGASIKFSLIYEIA